jgi:hypothetical protein
MKNSYKFSDKVVEYNQPPGVFPIHPQPNGFYEGVLSEVSYQGYTTDNVSTFSRIFSEPLTVNDYGGAGDCFFRCLIAQNEAYRHAQMETLELTIENYYHLLDLPLNTFIEDDHINKLAVHTQSTFLIITELDGKAYLNVYGTFGPVYLMVNIGLYHYLGVYTNMLEEDLSWRKGHFFTLEAQRQAILAGTGMLSTGAAEALESEEELVGNYSTPVNTRHPAVLYSYLLDSNTMVFPNPALCLENFYHVHGLVVWCLSEIAAAGCVVHPDFMKAYYKFRHNVFAYLCRYKLTNKPSPLETDVPLTTWLPECDKTPDFIVTTLNDITIYEFTVGNTYERIEFYKGGGGFQVKYQKESELIQQKHGLKVNIKIVPCVLNSYNMREVATILGADEDFIEMLKSFYETCNRDKYVISSSNFQSEILKVADCPLIPGLVSYERPLLPDILMLPADVISGLSTNYREFLTSLSTMSNQPKILCYNLKTGKYFTKKSEKGWTPEAYLKHLGQDFTTLLKYLHFFEGSEPRNLRDIRGTVPVTVPGFHEPAKVLPWDYIPQISYFYDKEVPEYKPGYGELACFTEKQVYSTEYLSRVNFPPDYFQQLCEFDIEKLMCFKGNTMLYNCEMNLSSVVEGLEQFLQEMQVKNMITHVKTKPTFLFPFPSSPSTPTRLDDFSDVLLDTYIQLGRGEYTKTVLKKVKARAFVQSEKVKFTDDIREAYEEYHGLNSDFHKAMYDLTGDMVSYRSLTKEQQAKIKPLLDKLNVKRKHYQGLLGSGKSYKGERMVSIARGKNSTTGQEFEREMSHYGSADSNSGAGLNLDNDGFEVYLKSLVSRLFATGFHRSNYPRLYNEPTGLGPDFLTNLKGRYNSRYEDFYNRHFKTTLAEQITFFIQNLASFLFNESLKTYNSKFIKVDNLGMSNVLVLCRGGAKIFKNQRSRLFKCLFIMDSADLKFSGYVQNDNFEVFNLGNTCVVATPWSQVHQDVLFDYLSLSYRTFNQLYSCYTRQFDDFEHPVPHMATMPFLLSLHNRRKTEQFMHNSRYLIVNPLGQASNLTGIMKSFADKNYTFMDSYLRHCISKRYVQFASSLLEIREDRTKNIDLVLDKHKVLDLWFGEPIPNADNLTVFIYITYMMTKSPVNASIEQANNLWEILEDVHKFEEQHSDVEGLVDQSLRFNVLNFDPDVYEDDFKYDPVFCQYLGHHMAGYLKGSFDPGEIQNKWTNIFESDMDSVANSNGLRGYNPRNFFSKKGYEIVYEKVEELLADRDLGDMLEDYLEAPLVDSVNKIRSDRLKLSEVDPNYEKLVFHIVHKIQRGGGREIFCMDLNTKLAQNPIEKLLKFICGRVPNEFISIKSNKRHSIIHTDFYERPVGRWVKQVMRWVLDCRRWAPHSIFQKYIHFITGLSPMLPPGFIKHFLSFAEGMFSKKFLTREHVLSKMRNNLRFNKYKHIPQKMGLAADAYGFTVKFSFVMGIFNYLSTLLHAANQIVASEVIRNSSLSSGRGLVILDPKCHSDDSVVTSYHEDPTSVELSVKVYDWFLKGANHMLSIKKSQINTNVYLEFLSILYLFDRFVPVFPKFISSIPFKPTDEGYSADISFASSQAIELLANGGSHEEAYLLMKTTAKYISNVYNIHVLPGLPPQFLGEPDSHPVELLFAGAEADLYRFYRYNPSHFWAVHELLTSTGFLNKENPNFSLDWDMNAMLTNKQKAKLAWVGPILEKYEAAKWTISNNKLGNSFLNLLWYYNKLADRKFVSSLTHEPEARKFSRIFGAGGYRRLKSADGSLVPVTDVVVSLQELQVPNVYESVDMVENYLEYMGSQLFGFYDSLAGTDIVSEEPSNLKDKPIIFRTGAAHLGHVRMSANEYVTYKKEPEAYKLLGKMSNPNQDSALITEAISVLGINPDITPPDMLYRATRKLLSFQEKTFRLVASIPSNSKVVDTMSGVLNYMCHSSRAHMKLIVKNKSAHEYDWTRKITAGKMPQSAVSYMKSYWLCKILQDYNILDMDLYYEDPKEKERQLAKELPEEWKMILTSTVQSKETPLAHHNHWIYWEKEQIKLGTRWVGEGSCIVKVPEAISKIHIANGTVVRIDLSTSHTGFFTASSSWYLNNILKYTGINASFSDPSYQPPNSMCLGYVFKEKLYGFGRPRMFDFIVDNVRLSDDPTPSDFFDQMSFKMERNHYRYFGRDTSYYIDFFVPTEDPVTVSFKGIFDLEKVRMNAENLDLRRFIKKASVDISGFVEIDRDSMLNNIGSSLIYNIIFNSPNRPELMEGLPENYLVTAFEAWKTTHPDFGYPTPEELVEIARSDNRPPFPNNIMRHILKLGRTTLSEFDFRNMLVRLAGLEGEEKLKYLQNNFGYMDSEMRSRSLVLSMRSKIIFRSCALIGGKTLSLLVPVTKLLAEAVRVNSIEVTELQQLKNMMKFSKNKNITSSEILMHMAGNVILDGLYVDADVKNSKTVARYYKILKNLWNKGLGPLLNLTPFNDPILTTVDFNVDWEVFSTWLKHLINAHFKYRYGRIYKKGLPYRKVKKNQFSDYLSDVNRLLMRYDVWAPPEIKVTYGKKGKDAASTLRLKLEAGQPGITKGKFFVMTEDAQEEYNDGYSFDSDAEDEAIEDPEGYAPKYGYVQVPALTLATLTSKRGAAWNVFYFTRMLDRSILRAYGEKVCFKKIPAYDDFPTYLRQQDMYIFYVGVENTHGQIEGYRRLSWEETMQEMRDEMELDCGIEIDGVYHPFSKIEKSAQLQSQLLGFDSYFKNLREEVKVEVENAEQLIDTYSLFESNKGMEKSAEKLKTFISKAVEAEEVERKPMVSTAEALSGLDLHTIFKEVAEAAQGPSQAKSGVKQYIRTNYQNFSYEEPLKILVDLRARSEFNSLLPGYLDRILNGDVMLSKKTKSRIVRYALGQIALMPREMRPKYRKLLFIIKSTLTEIRECNFLENEDLKLAAMIDDFFTSALDVSSSDEEEIVDLLPDMPDELVKIDLSKIF